MFPLYGAGDIVRKAGASPRLIQTQDLTCQACHLWPGVPACLGTGVKGWQRRAGAAAKRAQGGGGAHPAAQSALRPGLQRLAQPLRLPQLSPPPPFALPLSLPFSSSSSCRRGRCQTSPVQTHRAALPCALPLLPRPGEQRGRAGRSPWRAQCPPGRAQGRKWGNLRGAGYPRTAPDCAGSLRRRGRWRCAVSECYLSACASTGVTSVWMGKCVRADNQPTGLCP